MSFQEKTLKLWKEDHYKDFTFNFQGSESMIKAHQCLLASTSTVFDKMFTVEMAESKQKEVTITDYDEKVFGLFLSLFYGYKIEGTEDLTTGIKCYKLCHQYEADQLESHCSDFIVKKATILNLEELLEFIKVYDVQAVKDAIKKILSTGNLNAENADHLIHTEDLTTGIKCYKLCHQYEFHQFKSLCSDFIVKKATILNLEELLEFTEVYYVQSVKDVTKTLLSTGNVTVDNAVHLIQIAAKINDYTIEYTVKNRVFEFICDKKILVSSITNWNLISGTVGDELQEFLMGYFSRKVARMESDASFQALCDKLRLTTEKLKCTTEKLKCTTEKLKCTTEKLKCTTQKMKCYNYCGNHKHGCPL